jgi:hypothetical protein
MKCTSANNNQAICSGGLNPESSNPYYMKDEWPLSLGVIDMTRLKMQTGYDDDALPYAAPDIVRKVYDNP